MTPRTHLAALLLALAWCIAASAREPEADDPLPGVPRLLPVKTIALAPQVPNIQDSIIAIDPAGRVALVTQDHETVDLWLLVVHHWRYWLGVLSGLSLLIAFFLARRILRRRREAGRPYCRRCNYDLTGASGETCSECGAKLAGRGTVRGRATWRRLAPIVVPALLLPGVFAYGWLFEPGKGAIRSWFYWPSDALHERYAGNFPDWIQPGVSTRQRVHELDLHTGQLWPAVIDLDVPLVAAAISPDDARVFLTDGELGLEWDFAQRRVTQRIVAPPQPSSESMCTFGIWYKAEYIGPRTVQSAHMEAIEWDLEKGEAKWLVEPAGTSAPVSQQAFSGDPPLLSAGVKPYAVDAQKNEFDGRPVNATIRVWDRNGIMVREFMVPGSAAVGLKDRILQSVHLSDDGLTLWVMFTHEEDGIAWIGAWDLRNGSFKRACILPDAKQQLAHAPKSVLRGDYLFIDYSSLGGVCVFDTRQEKWIARLATPGIVMVESVTVSHSLDSIVLIVQSFESNPVTIQALHYDLTSVIKPR